MSETYKTCPICGAVNARGAHVCSNCGTSLDDPAASQPTAPRTVSKGSQYDFRYGETDLLEDNLKRVGQFYLLGLTITLILIMAGGLLLAFRPVLFSGDGRGTGGQSTPGSTNRPTISLPTVTVGPPTLTPSATASPTSNPTPTPTREPCLIRVEPNDGLYTIVQRCGHRLENLDIIDVVLQINNIDNPQLIRQGQIIEVPWPTETPDPAALPTETPQESGNFGESEETFVGEISAFDENFDPSFFPTATLQPGIAIHNVVRDENIIVIALAYGANVEILSQLNPEISFSQCDFGQTFGGPRCTVQIFEGQQIRVPAPTSTPTIPPTPSGSETPTPTPTATFNAPSAISPSNRAFFRRDELVTLRWGASGTLSESQTYRLRVENVTDGIVYAVDTINNSYTLPAAWQGASNQRYEFTWHVSVIDLDNPNNPYFTTTPRTFFWEGRR